MCARHSIDLRREETTVTNDKERCLQTGQIADSAPRREFRQLLAAYLALATAGTLVGGAKEAKAQVLQLPAGCHGSLAGCLDPHAFYQFVEFGFDRITPTFGEHVDGGTPGKPGFVEALPPQPPQPPPKLSLPILSPIVSPLDITSFR